MKVLSLLTILLIISVIFLFVVNNQLPSNNLSDSINSTSTLVSLESSLTVETVSSSNSSSWDFECEGEYLTQKIVDGIKYCTLDVPYFNQVLNSSGVKTDDPAGLGRVSYMCTAASSVMIMGYYGRLAYLDTDELREHMYKSLSVPELKKDSIVKVNGTNIKLCMDGAFALTSYDTSEKKSMCNWNNNVDVYFNYLGYKVQNVKSTFEDAVKELNQGRPILFAIAPVDEIANTIESHTVVAKGYSVEEGKKILLLNDPDRDLNVKNDKGKCGGLSMEANLDGENSIFNFNDHKCSRINNLYSIFN